MPKILVIGGGGAGLTCAIKAKEIGADVTLVTKQYPTRSQTCMAQGGINAAISKDDSIELHVNDTIKASKGLSDKNTVEFMCKNAPKAVRWLDSIGVCFSRDENGNIAQRRLGGASHNRACYAQDYTGLKILHTLYDKAVSLDIEIQNEKYLLDLLVCDGVVYGAKFLNIRDGIVENIFANSVILATGGFAKLYGKHSTNSNAATGDGIAAALRAGAKLSNMEFIQFHPTSLKSSSILISESARGAGGYIYNSKKERFVDELLPRDEVARAIDKQIKAGENVYLDIRHLGERFIDEELPQERKLAKLYEGVDPLYEPIPIKPAAHYTMGGIEVDENSQTNIKGLFAVGECANHQVHGANRLGGNSLLELVVFGLQAGEKACEYAKTTQIKNVDTNNVVDTIKTYKNELNFYECKDELSELFYKKVGITRDEKGLMDALNQVEKYIKELPLMAPKDTSKIYNTNLVEFLEFKNMLELSKVVIQNALARKESIGAHFREDT